MRTTVDLPAAVHRRAKELAEARGLSMSVVIADLTVRGLSQLDEPVTVLTDPVSGYPVVSIGRRVTAAEVSDFLAEE
jgi:hypothetical protein